MAFNPVWNQFSVAPVGENIIVGNKRALSGGLTRESAVNLIAWLVISTGATMEEIGAEIESAMGATPEALSPILSPVNAGRPAVPLRVVDKHSGQPYTLSPPRPIVTTRRVDEVALSKHWGKRARAAKKESGEGGNNA